MSIGLRLGHTPSGNEIIWRNADNPHLYVSGQSGTGKSFFFKKKIPEAVEQGATCIVFDYSRDFLRYESPNDIPYQHIEIDSPSFTINPLLGPTGQGIEYRVEQLLSLVRSTFTLGNSTVIALRQAAKEYLAVEMIPTPVGLLNFIMDKDDKGSRLMNAIEPLELLCSLIHSDDRIISLDLTAPGLTVLGFQNIFDSGIRKCMVNLLLQAIWNQRTASNIAVPNLILILDEAQNLDWGKASVPARILREGRKFGISGWFASQWIDNKEASAALGQAALQAHFRPDDQHIDKLARSLCSGRSSELPRYRQLIQSLHRGEFLWKSPGGKCVRVKVPK